MKNGKKIAKEFAKENGIQREKRLDFANVIHHCNRLVFLSSSRLIFLFVELCARIDCVTRHFDVWCEMDEIKGRVAVCVTVCQTEKITKDIKTAHLKARSMNEE